jgi:hypothetical protein
MQICLSVSGFTPCNIAFGEVSKDIPEQKKVLIDRFNIEWKDLYNDGKIKNNFNK